MTLLSVQTRRCECCGYDVARLDRVPIGFRVICDPEKGGCGAFSAAAASEAAAVDKWNLRFDPCPGQQPGAAALVQAAARRAMGAGVLE